MFCRQKKRLYNFINTLKDDTGALINTTIDQLQRIEINRVFVRAFPSSTLLLIVQVKGQFKGQTER